MDALKGAFNSFAGGNQNQNPNQQGHGQGQGQNQGYNQGYNQDQNQGYNQGQNQGYNQGQDQGYNQGQNQGYNQGHNQGHNQGSSMQDGVSQNQQGSSGGFLSGLTNKFNTAAGGGPESEKNEDYLDKGVDFVQEKFLGQGPQNNESAMEQAKDEQISDFIRGKYKSTTGSDFPIKDKETRFG